MEGEKIASLVELAQSLLGTPYKYGATPEEAPQVFDCSSFTQYLYKKIGVELQRSSILQATQGDEVNNKNDLRPGDLLFFRGARGHYNDGLFPGREVYVGHVVFYLGENKVIYASDPLGKVVVKTLAEGKSLWGPMVMAKRIVK
ncbi:MAG TPA: C40 family peptidase [Candidatus Paceibacterota bacterium]